ncbi:MAG: peptidyl-prolyl cis-trans isomerase [Desulfuromonadales bacterium]|nr:peptidyl-prolyl cis-trans isomerase [Desulfuromonadales bacterium]
MRKEWFLFLLCLFLPLNSLAVELNRVVAVINNDAVTSLQLDKALAAAAPESAAIDERRQVLERLIEESLMRQRAEEIGLSVSDEEVEAAVQDVLRQNRLTKEQLDVALTQQGIAPDDYRLGLRRQILRFKLVGREVQSLIEVSNREIQDYYGANSAAYRQAARIALQHISFPLTGQDAKVQEERGNAARAALRSGTEFASVLAAAVQDGADGGDMGELYLEDLTPAFAAAVKDLPVGGSSELIASEQALHLFVVTARTPGKVRSLDEVREEIRSQLAEQKRATAAKDWLEGLKKRAHIEIKL